MNALEQFFHLEVERLRERLMLAGNVRDVLAACGSITQLLGVLNRERPYPVPCQKKQRNFEQAIARKIPRAYAFAGLLT